MGQLTGSTAVITGGARGIGNAIARALAEHGSSIGLIDILDETPAAANELASTTGVFATGVIADVRDPHELDAAFSQLSEALGVARHPRDLGRHHDLGRQHRRRARGLATRSRHQPQWNVLRNAEFRPSPS